MFFILHLSRTPVRETPIEPSKVGLVGIQPQRESCIAKIVHELIGESRFMRLMLENAVLKLACESISQEYMDKPKEYLRMETIPRILCEIKKISPQKIRMKYTGISQGYFYLLPPFYYIQVLQTTVM